MKTGEYELQGDHWSAVMHKVTRSTIIRNYNVEYIIVQAAF